MTSKPPTIEDLLAHREFLERLARRLADPDAAAEIVQETWLRAVQTPPPRSDNLRGWLVAVARSVLRRRRERERRVEPDRDVELEPVAAPDESPDVALDRALIAGRLASAVHALDEPYRTVLLLRYWEDLPPTAIAARLRRPVNTVTSQLRRGLDRLRERLDREHGGRRERRTTALVALLPRGAAPGAGPARPIAPVPAAPRAHLAAWALGLAALPLVALAVLQRPSGPATVSAETVEPGVRGARPLVALDAEEQRAPIAPPAAAPVPAPEPDTAVGWLDVTAVDERGRAVPGALVRVTHDVPVPPSADPQHVLDGRWRTDANGRVSIPLAEQHAVTLPGVDEERSVGVVVSADGFARTPMIGTAFPAGSRAALRVPLRGPALRVHGRVTDEEHRPIAGAYVQFGRPTVQITRRADGAFVHAGPSGRLTRADGRYDEPGLPRERHSVVVEAPGFLPHYATLDGRGRAELGHDVVLSRGATLRGWVVDEDGDPVAGALVRTRFRSGDPQQVEQRATSLADGSYVLSGLRPGTLWVSVEPRGRPETCAVTSVVLADGEEREETLVLRPSPRLALRLETEDGAPLAGASVHVHAAGFEDLLEPHGTTDARGRVAFPCLPAIAHAVEIHRSAVDRTAGALPCLVVSGVEPAPDELRIVIPSERLRTGRLRGRLVDHAGAPLESVRLWARIPPSRTFWPVPVDEAGAFAEEVPAQPYELVAVGEASGATPLGPVTVRPDETRELGDVRLPPPVELAVDWHLPADPERAVTIVERDAWEGVDGVKVWHVLTRSTPPSTLRLWPGTYELTVHRRGATERVLPFEVGPDAPTTLVVDVGPAPSGDETGAAAEAR